MKATGAPSPEELALLEPFRDKLPPEVFGEPYVPPVTDGSGRDRDSLKKAEELLTRPAGVMTACANANGETLEVEFLIFEDGFERIIGPYVKNLQSDRRRRHDPPCRSRPVRAAHEVVRLRCRHRALFACA